MYLPYLKELFNELTVWMVHGEIDCTLEIICSIVIGLIAMLSCCLKGTIWLMNVRDKLPAAFS